MRVADLDYELPAALIAQRPAGRREDARLMVVDPVAGTRVHSSIAALAEHLPEGAVVVVNDTRVRRARLRGVRSTGGAVELLLVDRRPDGTYDALGRASKPLRPGTRLALGPALTGEILGRDGGEGLLHVRLDAGGADLEAAIEAHGEVPLPPYVRRRPDDVDAERYQTVFARHPGAVAAPTAGLHLTEPLLARMAARGLAVHSITLHVGLGTFAPVTVDDLDQHPMHVERYAIGEATAHAVTAARAEGRPVVAVGTTVVRTLESAADPQGRLTAGPGETRLLLQPGARFAVVDALLTNFHVPRSTLLALVMAFAGREAILSAYAEAIRLGYRFFSYGDAMLLTRRAPDGPR